MSGMIADRKDDLRLGTKPSRFARHGRPALAFLAMALAALLLVHAMQIHVGADRASFGAYPDESSHYLSGLLVRDYIAHGFPGSPVHYAMNYYLHVPYFAIGHWPPLFYLLEGFWMMVFGHSHAAVLWLIASISALLATTIFAMATRYVSVPAA